MIRFSRAARRTVQPRVRSRSFALLGASALALVCAAGTAQAETIDTFSVWNGTTNIFAWGFPAVTPTYGQVITPLAGATKLNDFTFYIQNNTGTAANYQAYVYAWDGTKITGAALYTSVVLASPASTVSYTAATVNTGGTILTAGQQYVLFFSTLGVTQAGPDATSRFGRIATSGTYTGGDLIFSNSTTFAALSTTAWSNFITGDMAFIAHLVAASHPIDTGAAFYLSSDLNVGTTPDFTGGTLRVAAAGTIADNFTVGAVAGNTIDANGLSGTFSGNFTGAGGMTFASTVAGGTIILTGNGNTYTGGTTINSGTTLQIGNGGLLGALAGNIVDNGTVVFNRSDSYTYAGVVSGTGAGVKLGAGTLTITGNNTFTGGTTITAGTLQIGDGGTTGSIAGNVVDNGTLVFNRSDNVTFSGVISGTGTLTKLGAGTLVLNGANTASGLTTVSAGTLQVGNSANPAARLGGNVTVAGGATLNGFGTIAGSVTNNGGTVHPGGSIGTLTVGSYTQSAGGTFAAEVSPTAASLLIVNGTATLAGAVEITFQPGNYTSNYYQLIRAQSIVGSFDTVRLINEPDAAAYGLYYDAARQEFDLVIADETSAAAFTNLSTVALDTAQAVSNLTLDRLGRDNCDADWNVDPTEACGKRSAWLRSYGDWTHSSFNGTGIFHTRSAGILGGLDYAVGGGRVVGAAFNYATTQMRSEFALGNAQATTYRGALYAGVPMGPARFDGQVFYASSNWSTSRVVVGSLAKGHPDSDSFGFSFRARYPLGNFTPELQVAAANTKIDAFTETGSRFSLVTAKVNEKSLRARAGAKWSHDYEAEDGTIITPSIGGGLEYDVAAKKRDGGVALNLAVSSGGFTTEGLQPDRGAGTFNLSISARCNSLQVSMAASPATRKKRSPALA